MPEVHELQAVFKRLQEDITDEYYEHGPVHDFRPIITKGTGISAILYPAMQFTLMLVSAFIMGCIAAVPAGPVQIEVVRRSVNGHLRSSFLVIFGAFLVDLLYGIIACFGIAPIIEEKRIMVIFWLIGGGILIILGILILRHSLRTGEFDNAPSYLRRKRWGFASGISLSITNPALILWWLAGLRIFQDTGLIQDFTPFIAVSFLAACGLGLATYLVVMSLFLSWAKRFISLNKIRQLNMVCAICLFLIAGYFIFSSFEYFFTHA
jgi:threonine/homoserine/homoserine lactone efflux protein